MALHKSAIQSGTFGGGDAPLAVDGNSNDNFQEYPHENSCAHTWHSNLPAWWGVDLQEEYYIDHIVIQNRGDCCKYQKFISCPTIHVISLKLSAIDNDQCDTEAQKDMFPIGL